MRDLAFAQLLKQIDKVEDLVVQAHIYGALSAYIEAVSKEVYDKHNNNN